MTGRQWRLRSMGSRRRVRDGSEQGQVLWVRQWPELVSVVVNVVGGSTLTPDGAAVDPGF